MPHRALQKDCSSVGWTVVDSTRALIPALSSSLTRKRLSESYFPHLQNESDSLRSWCSVFNISVWSTSMELYTVCPAHPQASNVAKRGDSSLRPSEFKFWHCSPLSILLESRWLGAPCRTMKQIPWSPQHTPSGVLNPRVPHAHSSCCSEPLSLKC